MSVVIAIVNDGVVYMGADTQITFGDTKKQRTNEAELKIAKIPGHNILIGEVGAVRVSNIMLNSTHWFEDLLYEPLTKEFLVTKLLPKFYRALQKRDLLDEEHPASYEGSFLIAQEDRLYLIQSNFVVKRVPCFDAIGSGRDAAKAAYRIVGGTSVKEQILQGLRLAAAYNSTIGAPYVLCDTKNLTYEFVEE